MAERTNIPSSPACGLWETLLADALDGQLRPEDEATFSAHMASCPACTVLFDEARKGREWLAFLAPEPEAPSGLLDRILAQTGPGQLEGFGLASGGGNVLPVHPGVLPAWQRPGMVGRVRRFAEPRLLMTAAMAFFSIALTLNLAGVRVQDLRLSSLRAGSLQREFYSANARVVQYYEGLRVVYVLESRVRDLEGAMQDNAPAGLPTGSEEPQPKAQPRSPAHEPAGQPEQRPQSHGSGPAFRPAPDSGISRRSEPELLVAGMSSYKESDGSRREEQETRG
jgi:hypothetical protein